MTTILGVPQISQVLLEDLDRVGRKYDRWTPQAYFELAGAYLVEYSRGNLEILPMPTVTHQRIASWLFTRLNQVAGSKGDVLFAGTRVKVSDEVFREPDVLFIPSEWAEFVHDEYTERAGLVIEVLSESNRDHDLDTKRREYASAGIPEYWIIDPQEREITILKLERSSYLLHGQFAEGATAVSAFVPDFTVDVSKCFAAAIRV